MLVWRPVGIDVLVDDHIIHVFPSVAPDRCRWDLLSWKGSTSTHEVVQGYVVNVPADGFDGVVGASARTTYQKTNIFSIYLITLGKLRNFHRESKMVRLIHNDDWS